MKRFLMLSAACALVVPALQPARAADVSLDYFYDNLNGRPGYAVAAEAYDRRPDVSSSPCWPSDANVIYVERTVNVTNITYNNGRVYNYGPDYGTLSAYSVRPIQRLRLERANIEPIQAVKMGNVTKVEGDNLVLAAPMKLQKAPAQMAPPKLKGKIEQPKLEKGWANITDPGTKARLVQKFKSENPKNIPKPNIPPRGGANTAANLNAPNATAGAPAPPGGSPFQGKGKGKGEKFQ